MAEFGSGGFNLDGLNFLVDRFGKEGKQKRALTSKMTEEQMRAMEMFAQQNPGMNSAMLPILQAHQNVNLTKANVGNTNSGTERNNVETDGLNATLAEFGIPVDAVNAKTSQRNADTARLGVNNDLDRSAREELDAGRNGGFSTQAGAELWNTAGYQKKLLEANAAQRAAETGAQSTATWLSMLPLMYGQMTPEDRMQLLEKGKSGLGLQPAPTPVNPAPQITPAMLQAFTAKKNAGQSPVASSAKSKTPYSTPNIGTVFPTTAVVPAGMTNPAIEMGGVPTNSALTPLPGETLADFMKRMTETKVGGK